MKVSFQITSTKDALCCTMRIPRCPSCKTMCLSSSSLCTWPLLHHLLHQPLLHHHFHQCDQLQCHKFCFGSVIFYSTAIMILYRESMFWTKCEWEGVKSPKQTKNTFGQCSKVTFFFYWLLPFNMIFAFMIAFECVAVLPQRSVQRTNPIPSNFQKHLIQSGQYVAVCGTSLWQ